MKKPHKPDYVFLGLLIIILIFGIVILISASSIRAFKSQGDIYYFAKHQFIFGILLGSVIFIAIQKINFKYWKKIAPILLVLSLVMLGLVLAPNIGCKINGAKRWICIPGFSFQPSEIAKLSLIIFLASWFSGKIKSKQVACFKKTFLPFIIILCVLSVLMVLEPDVGTLGLLILISLIIYFFSGAKLSHIFLIILSGAGMLAILIKKAPYRFNRLLSFIKPELDPQGIGWQIKQALITIGSGGIFGLGLGHSQQKQVLLPMPIHDSIFAVLGEELGFVGAMALIILFMLLFWRGMKIAKHAPDDFSKLLALGIVSWFALQSFINIMAITGLMPLTGMPLPFVSYGSSSLVISMAGAGILFNISKYTNKS